MLNIQIIKSTVDQTQEMARKIWLAGIGVSGKGFDNIQNQYEKSNTEMSSLFNELVARGESLETKAKTRIYSEKIKVTTLVASQYFDIKTKLGLNKTSVDLSVEQLNTKIDALTIAIASLADLKLAK